MDTWRGKTVLVTGASSGIGKAFAEILAAKGANLVIVARSEEKLNELALQLSQQHAIRAHVIALDLGQLGAAEQLYQQTQAQGITVDLLVNNAGFGKWGEFLDFEPAVYESMLLLNINALVALSQAYLPGMLARKSGGIINVGSSASLVPLPYAVVYAASKAFVLSFSEGLYGECAPHGVHVMALCPGGTDTNFAQVATTKAGSAPAERSMSNWESPHAVVTKALAAFEQRKTYLVSGLGNYLTTALLPRLLPRKTVVGLVGAAWKKVAMR